MGKVTKIPITVATDDDTDSEQIDRVEQNQACDPPAAKPSATKKRNRARAAFRQCDVTRALRGAIKAGFGPGWRVRIEPNGTILIEMGEPVAQHETEEANEWDDLIGK
jgi:hypothetical protein